jgi:uncharacterized protein (TIGR00290 family)
MSERPRAAISWSGGKDSCAALHRAHADYDVVGMITMFDEAAERSRSHGLRPEVLAAQADRLGLRRFTGRCTWETYDATFAATLAQAKADAGITHVIFGDILFDEHRRWAETMCDRVGLVAVEPLCGSSTLALFEEWTGSGADALIVTARAEFLDETWLGRPLRRDMLDALTRLGVDPCGERGEYHTVVTNSPLFSGPIALETGARVQHSGCWALDVTIGGAEQVALRGSDEDRVAELSVQNAQGD